MTIVLCLLGFCGLFSFFILRGVEQTGQQLEAESQAAAQVVATNGGWMAQLARQTLLRVDASLGPFLDLQNEQLKNAVGSLPTGVNVYVVDESGDTKFATVPGMGTINVADRRYFAEVRQGMPFYTSGLMISRLHGENIFIFVKRIERNGAFRGAVLVSFNSKLLQEFWASLDLGAGSTVSLVRIDGELMARYPQPDGPVDLSDSVLIAQYLPQAPVGTYVSKASPVDGVARVVSYRLIPDTRILALASIATEPRWAAFRTAVWTVILIVAPIVLGLMGGWFWVLQLLRRDRRQREDLQKALETNTLLFREIHHRVKNNLQSVQSLVRMQEMPTSAKVDLQSRLTAMVAMHEHIYRHDRYEEIDASELIPVVVDDVVRSYGSHVEVSYDLSSLPVDRDHLTPLSLLLAELVTNALKYAFPDNREGRIAISLEPAGEGRCLLRVSDNGVGMAEPLPGAPQSMGMRLIRGVVAQMAGHYAFTVDNGTIFEGELALSLAGHQDPVAAQ
ncbi:hypothetical protein IC608_03335 [Devosia sp. PTR5]|uniref:histidine kinase n=1 Tax=Devosia oryzisoli TaxID=2774138 RepID=A0A927FQQ5_9HYPH|nr:hypothetical protein [Devosia oryzisoli]